MRYTRPTPNNAGMSAACGPLPKRPGVKLRGGAVRVSNCMSEDRKTDMQRAAARGNANQRACGIRAIAEGSGEHGRELPAWTASEVLHRFARVLDGGADQRVQKWAVGRVACVYVRTLFQVATAVTPDDDGYIPERVRGALRDRVGPEHERFMLQAARFEVIEACCERLHPDHVDLRVSLRCRGVVPR